MSKPVLFYSDYCENSKHFIKMLKSFPDILNTFTTIRIDPDPSTKRRPNIFYTSQQQLGIKLTRVPGIFVENQLLIGRDCFKWLDFTKRQLDEQKNEIYQGYNANEMGSQSDKYAQFGSTSLCDAAASQDFQVFGAIDQKIQCPQEEEVNNPTDYSKIEQERKNVGNIPQRGQQMDWTKSGGEQYGDSQSERLLKLQMEVSGGGGPPRQQINFEDQNMGLAGQIRNSDSRYSAGNGDFNGTFNSPKQSRRQVEVNTRYEDLMQQREKETKKQNQPSSSFNQNDFQKEFL
jgi:hypothetical protein